jgi:hypothetical protein
VVSVVWTLLFAALAFVIVWGAFASEMPDAQKVAVAGGAREFVWSTQPTEFAVVVPLVPSSDCSFDQVTIPGGAMGRVKFCADTQRTTVAGVAPLFEICSVEANSLAVVAVPGQLVLFENTKTVTPPAVMDGQNNPVLPWLSVPVVQMVAGLPFTE